MIFNAGHFNKRIAIQSEVGGTDQDGYAIDGWSTVKNVWAMVKPLSGREYVQSKTTNSETITRFVIRYTKGLTTKMRIVYGGRVFQIDSILNDDEQNKTLTLIGIEVVSGG